MVAFFLSIYKLTKYAHTKYTVRSTNCSHVFPCEKDKSQFYNSI